MAQSSEVGRRTRVIRPYPLFTLEDALSVARAIYDVNAGLPFDRELLAGALGTTPKSSAFTMRLNASAAYGLTEGGYNDPDIRLTELGEGVVAPRTAAELYVATAAAAMKPDTFGKFYEIFDGKRLPKSAYMRSILQRELGIRPDLSEECLAILRDNGAFAGIVSEVDGEYFVRLPNPSSDASLEDATLVNMVATEPAMPYETRRFPHPSQPIDATSGPNRIFVGHIGDSEAASLVASMLTEFQIAVASPQISQDAGLLLSLEVSEAMRGARAAILIFSADDAPTSRDKMLALLGAASALFDNRLVVLIEAGGADLDLSFEGVEQVAFDADRPSDSVLSLLTALHKSGVIKVSA